MLDIKFIVNNPHKVKEDLKKRGKAKRIWLVDEIMQDYEHFRKQKKELDELRKQKNVISEQINKEKKKKNDAKDLLKKASVIAKKIDTKDDVVRLLDKEIQKKLVQIPNTLHKSVPLGKTGADNPEIKKFGKVTKPSFPLRNHAELAEQFGIGDFDAGRLVAGQGFNYIYGQLAMLDLALQRYGVDILLEKGFTLVCPPLLLNRETLSGVVNLSDFEEVIYKIENENLYLLGTAEHPLAAMNKGKVLQKNDLPLKLCAVTPCFRKEIGGHGVDMKGLFRMHQFNKVEQVVITTPEKSWKTLEEMQSLTEQFFKKLGIPYRVVEICSGDLGDKFARQYDIEAWFPRQQAYREVTSAGNCTDYQARRLNIRYIDGKEKVNVHILNNTMVATSRVMVAILENFQQKDGTVKIPKVLHKYTGFTKIEPKKKAK